MWCIRSVIGSLALLALNACAGEPIVGPSVMGLPGQGKSFEDFWQDDSLCQQYATQKAGEWSEAVAVNDVAVDRTSNPTAGSVISASDARTAGKNPQRRYDTSYVRCMYASGNTVQAVPPVHAGYPYGYVRYRSGWYGPPYGYGASIIVDGGWGWGPGWYHHFSG